MSFSQTWWPYLHIHSFFLSIILSDEKGACQIIQPRREERILKENIPVGQITIIDFIFFLLLQI